MRQPAVEVSAVTITRSIPSRSRSARTSETGTRDHGVLTELESLGYEPPYNGPGTKSAPGLSGVVPPLPRDCKGIGVLYPTAPDLYPDPVLCVRLIGCTSCKLNFSPGSISTFLPFIASTRVNPAAAPAPPPANILAPVTMPMPAPATAPPVVTRTSRLAADFALRSPSALIGLLPLTSVPRNGILLPSPNSTQSKESPNSPDLCPHLAFLTDATCPSMIVPDCSSVRPPASITGVEMRDRKRSLTCAVPELIFESISMINIVPSGITEVPAASIGVPSSCRPDGGRPSRFWANTWVVEANATHNRIAKTKAAGADLFKFELRDFNLFFIYAPTSLATFAGLYFVQEKACCSSSSRARLTLQGEMRTHCAY